MSIPDPSSHPEELFWVHAKTGEEYSVLHHALREKDLCPMVVYQKRNKSRSPIWIRTCDEFYDGRFIPNRSYVTYHGPDVDFLKWRSLNDWKNN